MNVKGIFVVGFAVLVSGAMLFFTGTSFAHQTSASEGGSRFIQHFDKDGDGQVSKEEFPGPAEHFARLDANGDGFIDQSEASKGPPHHGMRGEGFVARFDKDGDGQVSKEEFPGPEEHFARLDANGDGFIDQSEASKGPPMRGAKRRDSNN